MSKVFVVQEMNRFNYSDAERFGELHFMTTKEFRPYYNSAKNFEIMQDVHESMDQFDPAEDFLLMTGNPIVMSYAFHLAVKIAGYVKLLQWDGIQRRYQEFHFKPSDYRSERQ